MTFKMFTALLLATTLSLYNCQLLGLNLIPQLDQTLGGLGVPSLNPLLSQLPIVGGLQNPQGGLPLNLQLLNLDQLQQLLPKQLAAAPQLDVNSLLSAASAKRAIGNGGADNTASGK